MKCPICHGKGRIQDHKYNEEHDIEYLVYCEKKCEYCNGTGEVQMTNEEWFNTLSTEDKARFFADNDGTIQIGDDIDHKNTVMRWEKWLKEKHESEEK